MRIGQGYDIHIFDKDRPLILGGLRIRENDGLLGHSDADVLVHAIMDALLGASGHRDIGFYFSDKDEKYRGISSMKLLDEVKNMVLNKGFSISNIDATIIAEKPKLMDYIPTMIEIISSALGIDKSRLSIKATTKEKMDATGEGLSIEAIAVCLLDE